MRRKNWVLLLFIVLECYLVVSGGGRKIEIDKEEAGGILEGVTTTHSFPPPEGNTTFIDGITWCVALHGVSKDDLQKALDWACGPGRADCGPIQVNGPCFQPNTLVSHASYAFNNYYQQNGNSDIACNFGGTATLTKYDPSFGKCAFDASGSLRSSAPQLLDYKAKIITAWNLAIILMFFFLGKS